MLLLSLFGFVHRMDAVTECLATQCLVVPECHKLSTPVRWSLKRKFGLKKDF